MIISLETKETTIIFELIVLRWIYIVFNFTSLCLMSLWVYWTNLCEFGKVVYDTISDSHLRYQHRLVLTICGGERGRGKIRIQWSDYTVNSSASWTEQHQRTITMFLHCYYQGCSAGLQTFAGLKQHTWKVSKIVEVTALLIYRRLKVW